MTQQTFRKHIFLCFSDFSVFCRDNGQQWIYALQQSPYSNLVQKNSAPTQWTVPQLSIMIIYNSTWSILIQQIRIILSCDNLTQKIQKKDPFTSLHKIKANLPHWAEFEILRNGTCRVVSHFCHREFRNTKYLYQSRLLYKLAKFLLIYLNVCFPFQDITLRRLDQVKKDSRLVAIDQSLQRWKTRIRVLLAAVC